MNKNQPAKEQAPLKKGASESKATVEVAGTGASEREAQPAKAIFFDRDGTLNIDTGYLADPKDFRWTPGAKEAVRYANEKGYLAIVITNQSGVARGYFKEEAVTALHNYMNEELQKQGAHLDALYYCPHLKGAKIKKYDKDCNCRKPKPGLIQKALAAHHIDPAISYMVGDSPRDITCATAAGVRAILYDGGNLLETLKKAGI